MFYKEAKPNGGSQFMLVVKIPVLSAAIIPLFDWLVGSGLIDRFTDRKSINMLCTCLLL